MGGVDPEVLESIFKASLTLHIKEAASRTSSNRFQRHIDALAALLEKGEEFGVDEDVLVLPGKHQFMHSRTCSLSCATFASTKPTPAACHVAGEPLALVVCATLAWLGHWMFLATVPSAVLTCM